LKDIEKSPIKELAFSGVFRRAPDGTVDVIDDTFLYPNGIALSPDESTLYVSNTDSKQPIIRSYALGADGKPKSSSTFFDATSLVPPDAPGMPDGMKIDTNGNLFASGPGGILVISREGEHLGTINAGPGRPIANCGFGEDGHSLFLTAQHVIARIRVLAT